jgi:hypothetical protein
MTLEMTPAASAPDHAGENQNRTWLQEGIHDVTNLVWGNQQTTVRSGVETLTETAAKAVPLMMMATGKSYAATALIYGLDQARVGDSAGTQAIDFAAGAAKGLGTKYVFQEVGGSKTMSWAEKGVAMGGLSTALDVGLTRQTYIGQNGQTDVWGGVGRIASASLNPVSLATDALVFGAAHYGLKGLTSFAPAIENNVVAQNMAVGTIFGTTSGALGELQRERTAGENFNFGKVASASLLDGTAMALASIPGGMQMARAGVQPSAIAPERAPVMDTVRAKVGDFSTSLSGRIDDLTSSVRGKFSNFSSMLRGDDLGMALASGDVKGPDGEARRSVGGQDRPIQVPRDAKTDDTRTTDRPAYTGKTRSPLAILKEQGLGDYAQALSENRRLSSLKAIKFIGSGNETQAAILLAPQPSLPEGGVLKIGHYEGGFDDSWGSARRPFDAKILMKPVDLDLHGVDTTAYVQETLKTQDSYPSEDVNTFLEKVRLANLEWVDPGTDPTKQVGYNSRGDLTLLDYSAVGRPGENATLAELIGGRERVRQQEDDMNGRQQLEEEHQEEQQAVADYSDVNTSLEARRQDAVRDPNRSPEERYILGQLFMGESVEDVALIRAVEMSQSDPSKFDQFTKKARQEVQAVRKKALAEGLIEGKAKPADEY